MNKYQEALDYFLNRDEGDNLTVTCDWLSNAEELQEIVYKTIPMRPFLLVEHKNPKKRRYQCPICGNACLVRYAPFERNENRHCYNCGQKIDWSENE